MKRILLTIITATLALYISGQSNEPMRQNFIFKIDSIGNGNVVISTKLTAMQWQNWQAAYGQKNCSRLKRDIERNLNSMFLSDFNYSESEMDRSWKLSFNAKGIAKYEGNNKWIAELGIKNPEISKLTDHSFLLTSSYTDGGMLIQQSNTIFFPQIASNIKEGKDEFGNATFDYELKPIAKGSSSFLTLGLLFVGLSLISLIVLLIEPKFSKKTVKTSA